MSVDCRRLPRPQRHADADDSAPLRSFAHCYVIARVLAPDADYVTRERQLMMMRRWR